MTTKKMEVVEIDVFDKVLNNLDGIDKFKRDIISANLAVNVVHLNSIGRIVKNLNNENKHIGNRMECAFLEFLTNNDVDYENIRKETKEISQTNPSTEKRMVMTVVEHPDKEGYYRIYGNGSTDVFLIRCNEVLQENGKKAAFTFSHKDSLENQIIKNYKDNRLRVMALGYKDIKIEDYQKMHGISSNGQADGKVDSDEYKDQELIEKHFVLVCLIVLDDPIRGVEASEAVSD